MKKYIMIFIALAFLVTTTFAQNEVTRVGTTAANFLGMEVGTKAIALGGAFTAYADDATATFYNPAGMVNSNEIITHYETIDMYIGMNHQFAAAIIPIGTLNNIAFSVNYFSTGDMEITTIDEPDGTNDFFDAASYAVALSYSRRLTDRVGFGVTVKSITERIWLVNASGFAFDFGSTYRTMNEKLTIGMAIRNLGPSMSMNEGTNLTFTAEDPDNPGLPAKNVQYLTDYWDMPVSFNLGFKANIMGTNSLLASSEINQVYVVTDLSDAFDGTLKGNMGVEYIYNDFMSLRGGYRLNYDVATWSVGGGIVLPVSTGDLVIDYALSDWGDLGQISLYSLELKF